MNNDTKEKINKLANVLLWVLGLASWLQLTEFSYGLMNKSDNYLFYMGAFILVAVNATAAILIVNEVNRINNNKNNN